MPHYWLGLSMLSKIRPIRRARLLMTRPAWMLLAWSNRHTLRLWVRTLLNEIKTQRPLDSRRLLTLTRALVRVTTDSRVANSRELRMLWLDGDALLADAEPGWRHHYVISEMFGTSQVIDTTGRPST